MASRAQPCELAVHKMAEVSTCRELEEAMEVLRKMPGISLMSTLLALHRLRSVSS